MLEDTYCYGLDLSWDTALLSRYNTRTKEPEPVCFGKDNQELAMPVLLSRRVSDGGGFTGRKLPAVQLMGKLLRHPDF